MRRKTHIRIRIRRKTGKGSQIDFVHYEGKLGAYNSRLNEPDRYFFTLSVRRGV